MKTIVRFVGVLALVLAGCATADRHARYQERHYVIEDHPDHHEVIISRGGQRTYVRDYEVRRDYRGTAEFQNNMEPRVRGKHADSLGWNTENYYLQRGY
jgi:lipoprotein NlpI